MRKYLLYAFLSFVSLFVKANAFTEKEWKVLLHQVKIEPLKDLKKILVYSNLDKEDAQFLSISNEKVKGAIELKLRQCGIDVNPDLETSERYSFGAIQVSLVIIRGDANSSSSAYLNIEMSETGTTKRKDDIGSIVHWDFGRLFNYSDPKSLGAAIMDSLKDALDDFCLLYLEANPRKFIDQTGEAKKTFTSCLGVKFKEGSHE